MIFTLTSVYSLLKYAFNTLNQFIDDSIHAPSCQLSTFFCNDQMMRKKILKFLCIESLSIQGQNKRTCDHYIKESSLGCLTQERLSERENSHYLSLLVYLKNQIVQRHWKSQNWVNPRNFMQLMEGDFIPLCSYAHAINFQGYSISWNGLALPQDGKVLVPSSNQQQWPSPLQHMDPDQTSSIWA